MSCLSFTSAVLDSVKHITPYLLYKRVFCCFTPPSYSVDKCCIPVCMLSLIIRMQNYKFSLSNSDFLGTTHWWTLLFQRGNLVSKKVKSGYLSIPNPLVPYNAYPISIPVLLRNLSYFWKPANSFMTLT